MTAIEMTTRKMLGRIGFDFFLKKHVHRDNLVMNL